MTTLGKLLIKKRSFSSQVQSDKKQQTIAQSQHSIIHRCHPKTLFLKLSKYIYVKRQQ